MSLSLSPPAYITVYPLLAWNCYTGQLARNPQKFAHICLPCAQIKGVSHIQTHILGLLKDLKTVFENTENEDWVWEANDDPKYWYWRASGSFNFFKIISFVFWDYNYILSPFPFLSLNSSIHSSLLNFRLVTSVFTNCGLFLLVSASSPDGVRDQG